MLRLLDGLVAADAIVAHPIRAAVAIALDHALAGLGRQHTPVRAEQLEPVVLRRVVAGRNLNPAGALPRSDQDPGGGRGGNPGKVNIAAHGFQRCGNRTRQQRPGDAAIVTEHDRSWR